MNDKHCLDSVIKIQNSYREHTQKRVKSKSSSSSVLTEKLLGHYSLKTNASIKAISEIELQNLFQALPELNSQNSSLSHISSSSRTPSYEIRYIVDSDTKTEYYGETNINTGFKHGRGIQLFMDGSKYSGYFIDDHISFKGKLIQPSGEVYEGDWKNDKADGYGVCKQVNGAIYQGTWKNDYQEGRGKEVWPDGTEYEGEYHKGQRHGKGIFRWNDGSWYEGDFEHNHLNGKGVMTFKDKRKYFGEFKNNKMNGHGVFTWPDNRKYTGDYKDDKKEGYGVFEWGDGRIYKGTWKNGKQNGKGELFNPTTGLWKKGVWKKGKKINWIDSEDNVNIPKAIPNEESDFEN